uniref:Rho GTPase activating protein 28 n=1 Tax=Lates calcarifer TaxID=8187 RepID=A0A4W6EBG4_LATCA
MLSSAPTTSLPPSSSTLPPPNTVTSDTRRVAMETYWREVQSIEEEKEGEDEDEEEEEERKSMDEVELEEAWLTEAGLSSLVTGSSEEETPPPAEVLLSTLTRQQAATVRRRLDNYNETLKMRNRQPIRDVRDVFTQMTCRHVTSPGSASSLTSSSPPSCSLWASKPNAPARRAAGPGVRSIFTSQFKSRFESTHIRKVINDRKKFPGVKVPVVFQKLLCILEQTGLQTEGILRVPGSAARLKYLRSELDRCGGGFDWSSVRQVDAAGLLKLFIRELPTPLLTHTHLSTYRCVLGISSVVHQVQALQLLSLLLPEANRDTLRALLVFLRKVVSHQDHNRMSLWNVSMVMAPNLFSCRHHGNKRSIAKQQEEMEEAVGGAHLIRLMITHQDLLWTVPSFLLSQVRELNQASNQKQLGLSWTKRRLLRRKNDKNDRNQVRLRPGVIRVHAPLHTKVSMAIQLDGQTRAKDVTARFEYVKGYENLSVSLPVCLSGERRLHPDCVLLDVYRVNPHCDWLIKP